MKKITFMLALLLMAVAVQAQTPATVEKQANCTVDASGNYVAVAKTAEQPVATGKTFTDSKGKVYPVMKSAKGRLFVVKTSAASGKEYRHYLEPANPAGKPITQ